MELELKRLRARYPGRCILTGRKIGIGEEMLWSPKGGFALHPEALREERSDLVKPGQSFIEAENVELVQVVRTETGRIEAYPVSPRLTEERMVWDDRSLIENIYILRRPKGWQIFGWLGPLGTLGKGKPRVVPPLPTEAVLWPLEGIVRMVKRLVDLDAKRSEGEEKGGRQET